MINSCFITDLYRMCYKAILMPCVNSRAENYIDLLHLRLNYHTHTHTQPRYLYRYTYPHNNLRQHDSEAPNRRTPIPLATSSDLPLYTTIREIPPFPSSSLPRRGPPSASRTALGHSSSTTRRRRRLSLSAKNNLSLSAADLLLLLLLLLSLHLLLPARYGLGSKQQQQQSAIVRA